MRFYWFFLVVPLFVSCSERSSASLSKGDSPVAGQMIEVTGVAVNARLSAALQSESMLYYCIEIPEWPPSVVGKRVLVRGRLEKSDQFKARTGPSGERTAGTAGGDHLLKAVTWERN